jgi:transposase InsO family protein
MTFPGEITASQIADWGKTKLRTAQNWLAGIQPKKKLPGRGGERVYELGPALNAICDQEVRLKVAANISAAASLSASTAALSIGSKADDAPAGAKPVDSVRAAAAKTAGNNEEKEDPQNCRASFSSSKSLIELSESARAVALARDEVLANFEQFSQHSGLSRKEALKQFVELCRKNEIELSPEVKKISVKTLTRWLQRRRAGGVTALAPGWGNRAGSGMFADGELHDALVAIIAHFGERLSAPAIRAALTAKYPAIKPPSVSSIRRASRRWKKENPSLALSLVNPDRWRSSHRTKIARADADICRPGQRVELDGSPNDCVLVLNGRRWVLLGLCDVFTRRTLWLVAPFEDSRAAVRLIAKAIMAWGVPEEIVTDGGRGLTSNHVRRFLEDLGVKLTVLPPHTPQGKPFIERAIKTCQHEFVARQDGYVGHNVAERQALREKFSFRERRGKTDAQLLAPEQTPEDFQERLDVWGLNEDGERRIRF